MQYLKYFFLLLLANLFMLITVIPAQAKVSNLICSIIVKRNPAWQCFDINVVMFNPNQPADKNIIETFFLPKTTQKDSKVNQLQKTFDCYKYPLFEFKVTYLPPIWHTEAGKPIANTFNSRKIYDISPQLTINGANKQQLEIVLNFPEDFPINADPSLVPTCYPQK
jgi:hypothetical protein